MRSLLLGLLLCMQSAATPLYSEVSLNSISTRDNTIARDATLAGASITFHTNDEDKDGNSHVTITVKDGQKNIAAELDSDFKRFGDNDDNGPYNLDVFNPSTRAAIQSGTVILRLDPHGHDTWRFNWAITFTFSDGSKLLATAHGVSLSQDDREKSWSVTSK